jgi:hypothetical protein
MDVLVGVAQTAGVVLLVVGAVRLLRHQGRSVLTFGCLLQLAICLYYVFRYAASDADEPASGGSNLLVLVALLFGIMPAISMSLARSAEADEFEESDGSARPARTTAAAVLTFVQAGATLIITGILMFGLALSDEDEMSTSPNTATPLLTTSAGGVDTYASLSEMRVVALVQLIGIALLIAGGVRLLSGRVGVLFPIAVAVQAALCVYWLVRGTDPLIPVLLVVVPLAALVLALTKVRAARA